MSETGTAQDVVQQVWRDESARLVGALTRMTRDLVLAEDLAQDALVAALQQWPAEGVPDNPAAWLMQTAKRRAVDHFRRADTLRRRTTELGHVLEQDRQREEADMPDLDSFVDHIDDDVLRLIFLTCHPALSPESRAALTLRLVGGLTVPEIARAFLTKEATVGQRISRAKKTLAGESFDLPVGRGARGTPRRRDGRALPDLQRGLHRDRGRRLDACPTSARRRIRLARMLVGLAPEEPEVHGLLALMSLQASRLHARVAPDGSAVLLDDQDRRLWDRLMIRRGLASLDLAMTVAAGGRAIGPNVVQAQIAACHARAEQPDDTDWSAIASWYDVLAQLGDNPVVEVNRAVAHGRAYGPEEGLAVLDDVAEHRSLAGSHLVPSVRGDALERAGRPHEAATSFREAAGLTDNAVEQALLTDRALRLESGG